MFKIWIVTFPDYVVLHRIGMITELLISPSLCLHLPHGLISMRQTNLRVHI